MSKRVVVVFEEAEEMDGWWIASSPDLPGVLTQGQGLAQTIDNFRDAYELMIAPDDALFLGRIICGTNTLLREIVYLVRRCRPAA